MTINHNKIKWTPLRVFCASFWKKYHMIKLHLFFTQSVAIKKQNLVLLKIVSKTEQRRSSRISKAEEEVVTENILLTGTTNKVISEKTTTSPITEPQILTTEDDAESNKKTKFDKVNVEKEWDQWMATSESNDSENMQIGSVVEKIMGVQEGQEKHFQRAKV